MSDIHSSYLNTTITNETENQTGRVLFFVPYLLLCSISGNLCFCSNTKANPSKAVEAMHPTILPSTVCMSGIYFVWKRIYLIGSVLLECQRPVFAGSILSLLCFVSGYFHLEHAFTSARPHTALHTHHWTHSEMCPVSASVRLCCNVSCQSRLSPSL